jgi:hypothetical protein
MCILVSLYAAILFFVLTPGILLSLPKGGSKFQVAAVHALVFAVIFHFTHKLVWRFSISLEGFTEGADVTYYTDAACTTQSKNTNSVHGEYHKDASGKCKANT